jgi:hypothetical protein
MNDVAQPVLAAVVQPARFRHHDGPAIALPHAREKVAHRQDAVVPWRQRRMRAALPVLHLTEGVAIDPDHIEHLGASAQLRMTESADDVPGREGVLPRLLVGRRLQVGPVLGRGDQDQRVDVEHARAAVDRADGVHRRDVRLAERHPQPLALLARLAVGGRPAPLPAHEAPEGDLIDRGEEVRGRRARDQILGRGARIVGEPLDELGRIGIEVVGIAVVAEVPYRQDLVGVHGRDERLHPREVAPPPDVDHGPGHPLARRPDAQLPQERVVLEDVPVVTRLGHQVPPLAVLPPEGGALEP